MSEWIGFDVHVNCYFHNTQLTQDLRQRLGHSDLTLTVPEARVEVGHNDLTLTVPEARVEVGSAGTNTAKQLTRYLKEDVRHKMTD